MKRLAKVIVTVGPSIDTAEKIKELILKGVNVFRLNLSHGSWKEQETRIKKIRKCQEETGKNVGIMIDTRGPEIRMRLGENRTINKNQEITFGIDFTFSQNIQKKLKKGQECIFNDGLAKLVVSKTNPLKLKAKNKFVLQNSKKIVFPGINTGIANPIPEDVIDIKRAIRCGVDFIAVSFSESAESLKKIRKISGNKAEIISKIESKRGVLNLDEIIKSSDGIMIARGDLGVEFPVEQVPALQKKIVEKLRESGKPSIIATQMLESMITNNVPTRAEVSDIATAVWQRVSALMLSGETAIGSFPINSYEMMDRTIIDAEKEMKSVIDDYLMENIPEVIGRAVDMITATIKPKVTVCLTRTGFTAKLIAKERPQTPTIALTMEQSVANKLSLYYSVTSMIYNGGKTNDDRVNHAISLLKTKKIVKTGDLMLFTYGSKETDKSTTDTIKILKV